VVAALRQSGRSWLVKWQAGDAGGKRQQLMACLFDVWLQTGISD